MNENIWKRFDRDSARRERLRLIRNGTIRPHFAMKPQLMVINPNAPTNAKRPWADRPWSPEIVVIDG